MSLDDLYRELILDHFKSPRNHGKLKDADIEMEGVNPLCGDELTLTVRVGADGKVAQVQAVSRGCSISQASTSMMTEALTGRTLTEADALVAAFKRMMLADGTAAGLPEALEELGALEGVKQYPVRIKCALLAWNTWLEGVQSYRAQNPTDHHKVVTSHKET